MPTKKQVRIKKRTEPLIQDIRKYTEPLSLLELKHPKVIDLINESWEIAYRYDLLEHPAFFKNDHWNDFDNINYFKKKFGNDAIERILQKWKNSNHNIVPFVVIVRIFTEYNITDFSSIGKFLVGNRNRYVDEYNDNIQRINKGLFVIEYKKKIQQNPKKYKNIDILNIMDTINMCESSANLLLDDKQEIQNEMLISSFDYLVKMLLEKIQHDGFKQSNGMYE